jgi:hypothetical protein
VSSADETRAFHAARCATRSWSRSYEPRNCARLTRQGRRDARGGAAARPLGKKRPSSERRYLLKHARRRESPSDLVRSLARRSFFRNRTTRRLPVPPRDGHDSVVRICRCLALEHRQLHDDGSSHGVARAVWSPRDVKTVARPFDLEEASCRGARSETSVNLHTTLRSKGARALRNGTNRGVCSRYEWPQPPPYPELGFRGQHRRVCRRESVHTAQ